MSQTVPPGNVRPQKDASWASLMTCSARMPEPTPNGKKVHEVGYRQAVEALNKLDILGIATKRMMAAVNDIEKLTRDIDKILEFEAPSFPNVQLKRSCEHFMGAYEERLASLDPMRENGCNDSMSDGGQEMA
ncbi:hypothetical protein J7337_011116 [Fusarium musae]|uniref:Uncharacterized protein n=1 Tax=Fusarium musae TaxID=1042133 RepID=A0A9P8DAC3_9HYPO|nr:hypothetical protein J7337_011116 [Fusarium musae]KAG9498221.1 hypothetical protein J7337_011116 [Fusarium musae]